MAHWKQSCTAWQASRGQAFCRGNVTMRGWGGERVKFHSSWSSHSELEVVQDSFHPQKWKCVCWYSLGLREHIVWQGMPFHKATARRCENAGRHTNRPVETAWEDPINNSLMPFNNMFFFLHNPLIENIIGKSIPQKDEMLDLDFSFQQNMFSSLRPLTESITCKWMH